MDVTSTKTTTTTTRQKASTTTSGNNNNNNYNSKSNQRRSRRNHPQRRYEEQRGGDQDDTTNNNNHNTPLPSLPSSASSSSSSSSTILVLHGNRQTGQLFLGRIERLERRLRKDIQIQLIAPDGPFVVVNSDDDTTLQTWWNRHDEDDNEYVGLDVTLTMILQLQQQERYNNNNNTIVGILGFSQGARLCHLLAILHTDDPNKWFPHLKFVIMVAGYDAPIPPQLQQYMSHDNNNNNNNKDPITGERRRRRLIRIPSLHIWGESDVLVLPSQSEAVMKEYINPRRYIHPGNHFVPMRGTDMHVYMDFIRQQSCILKENASSLSDQDEDDSSSSTGPPYKKNVLPPPCPVRMEQPTESNRPDKSTPPVAHTSSVQSSIVVNHSKDTRTTTTTTDGCLVVVPDEETSLMQREEVQALEVIFPDEIELKSSKQRRMDDDDDEDDYVFDYPIIYHMKLVPSDDNGTTTTTNNNWPVRPLTLKVQYPHNYPIEAIPIFTLLHENNIYEFPSRCVQRMMTILHETATMEVGMPTVLSCIYAVKEFLDSPRDEEVTTDDVGGVGDGTNAGTERPKHDDDDNDTDDDRRVDPTDRYPLVRPSTLNEIEKANLEGLQIAESLLGLNPINPVRSNHIIKEVGTLSGGMKGGGSFGTYTIGLVGKPSAGKSTFFNAATAFSRQRGQEGDSEYGGASMAAHPFTTIDPNIGYCLVPAPFGSCPEDDFISNHEGEGGGGSSIASNFGSTHGRDPSGRRLIPVLLKDVAGLVPGAFMGKGRGNQFLNDLTDATVLVHVVDASGTADASGNKTVGDETDMTDLSNPLDDLAWVRNELVEWVYSNLMAKWDTVIRRGRTRLVGMFSGYGERESTVEEICFALETFLEVHHRRDRALDQTSTWDEADIHRLVSLFLGVRFPMALCLNKCDLPSAGTFVQQIENALPIHGAYKGTPMSVRDEMNFMRVNMTGTKSNANVKISPPLGVWQCLTSAMELREPVLVFPVSDMSTFAPMSGLNRTAVGDPSLPSRGMIQCITAAGGFAPSCWDTNERAYVLPSKSSKDRGGEVGTNVKLRDTILMKPGSTVEDVFNALKRLGALGGEFVRAEASSGRKRDKHKPVPKHEIVTRNTCVIKIMSTKRTAWQH